MMTDNKEVGCGEANGTKARCNSVELKPGETSFPLQLTSGKRVLACFASQVKELHLQHENDRIVPQHFSLNPTCHSFSTEIPTGPGWSESWSVTMKGTQLPVVSNTATTGHKLQGATLLELLVSELRYDKNWAYVVLSRVKTMKGLALKEKLSQDLEKYRCSSKLKTLLKKFEDNKQVKEIFPEEYHRMVL